MRRPKARTIIGVSGNSFLKMFQNPNNRKLPSPYSFQLTVLSFQPSAFSFYRIPFTWKGRCQHAAIRLRVVGETMPNKLTSDWSTRFIRVILLGYSVVRTNLQYRCTESGLQYKRTTDSSIVCPPQLCGGSVKLYSSVQLCTQKYIPSV